jgi:hypothetical protein
MSEKLPTIIDNAGENSVLVALKQILLGASRLDIATGFFEVSALLALGSAWQELEAIRIRRADCFIIIAVRRRGCYTL